MALPKELVRGNTQNNGPLRHSRLPTECVSPKGPRGSSALRCPRRIFSSLGKGGKKRGGGGWPGKDRSGKLGGADVNALKLCAYARSSGYGIAPIKEKKQGYSNVETDE